MRAPEPRRATASPTLDQTSSKVRTLRIAILCPYSLSVPGGVQGQVLGLARALRSSGHEVVVLAPVDAPLDSLSAVTGLSGVAGAARIDSVPGTSRGAQAGSLFGAGGLGPTDVVSFGRSVSLPANGSLAPVSLSPLAAVRAVRTVREGGFDVLHLHEPFAPGPGIACLLMCGEPKVGTFHRCGAALSYRVLGAGARFAATRLDVRCAVSPAAESTANRVLGGSYELVGNGVEIDRFESAEPWPSEGPTVLFVGRHERRKGLEVLLEAWDELEHDGHFGRDGNPTLWVCGEGPETAYLRRRYPGGRGVEWLGRVADSELASRLVGADLLCAPSLGGESFGVVLVEAMAARAAVVASDIPGYVFVAGDHALLSPPGHPHALAGALRRGLSDAQAKTGICAPEALDAAQAHARRWSMQAMASRYVEIYEALVH